MHNTYYFMRHGQSEANILGIIASSPSDCIEKIGLTDEGRKQAEKSARSFDGRISVIISSDFKRAKETADIAAAVFGIEKIEFSPLLRERYFGDYDGRPDSHYEEIWKLDIRRSGYENLHIETPDHVAERLQQLILQCEKKSMNEHILFVAHGDVIQIGLAVVSGRAPFLHRSIAHMHTAEIRKA